MGINSFRMSAKQKKVMRLWERIQSGDTDLEQLVVMEDEMGVEELSNDIHDLVISSCATTHLGNDMEMETAMAVDEPSSDAAAVAEEGGQMTGAPYEADNSDGMGRVRDGAAPQDRGQEESASSVLERTIETASETVRNVLIDCIESQVAGLDDAAYAWEEEKRDVLEWKGFVRTGVKGVALRLGSHVFNGCIRAVHMRCFRSGRCVARSFAHSSGY